MDTTRQLIVLDRSTMIPKETLIINNVTPKRDIVSPQKTNVEVPVNSNIEISDFVIVRNSIDDYLGIIQDVETKDITKLSIYPLINVTDTDAFMNSIKGSVFDWIVYTFTENFIGFDPYPVQDRLFALDMRFVDNTDGVELEYSLENGNFFDALLDIFLKTGVYISFGIEYNEENGQPNNLVCYVNKSDDTNKISIRYDNPLFVEEPEVEFSQAQSLNKVIYVPSENNKEHKLIYAWYLLEDNTITQDPYANGRIKGVVQTITEYSDDDFEKCADPKNAPLKEFAEEELLSASVNHLITMKVLNNESFNFDLFRKVEYIARDKTYTTFVTHVESFNDVYKIVKLGIIRTNLTDKVKALRRELTSTTKKANNSINNISITQNTFIITHADGSVESLTYNTGGGGEGGTTDYTQLINKPKLNTNNAEGLTVGTEEIDGTINLHKISKSGALKDAIEDSEHTTVMQAEKEQITKNKQNISKNATQIDKLQTSASTHETRITSLEDRVDSHDSDIYALGDTIQNNSTKIEEVENKIPTKVSQLTNDLSFVKKDYVDNKVSEEVGKVIDNAPDAFDTLKEIADWIENDEKGTSALINRVGTLEERADDFDKELGSLHDTISEYQIADDEKNKKQDGRIEVLEEWAESADTNFSNLDDEITKIKNNTTKIANEGGGFVAGNNAYANTQGAGETTLRGAVVIGENAGSEAEGNVQLGSGINRSPNTMQFKDWTIINESGKLPSDRLEFTPDAIKGTKVFVDGKEQETWDADSKAMAWGYEFQKSYTFNQIIYSLGRLVDKSGISEEELNRTSVVIYVTHPNGHEIIFVDRKHGFWEYVKLNTGGTANYYIDITKDGIIGIRGGNSGYIDIRIQSTTNYIYFEEDTTLPMPSSFAQSYYIGYTIGADGSLGYNASTQGGAAIGFGAKASNGAAVGYSANTGNGFAGGYLARTEDASGKSIDAIQLGTGTNNNSKTLQVYDNNIYNANTHTLTVDNIELKGKDLQNQLISDEEKTKWNSYVSLPIGSIISSAIPIEDASVHLLDGSIISMDGEYSAFCSYLKQIAEKYPKIVYKDDDFFGVDYKTAEQKYNNDIERTGNCGRFIIDDAKRTVRLPRITQHIQGLDDITNIGSSLSAGLPNLNGGFLFMNQAQATCTVDGKLFKFKDADTSGYTGTSANSRMQASFEFNAQAYNPIYGNSDTVQTNSTQFPYYIVVANSKKTDIEVNLDKYATDLNNLSNRIEEVFNVMLGIGSITTSGSREATLTINGRQVKLGWADVSSGTTVNFANPFSRSCSMVIAYGLVNASNYSDNNKHYVTAFTNTGFTVASALNTSNSRRTYYIAIGE